MLQPTGNCSDIFNPSYGIGCTVFMQEYKQGESKDSERDDTTLQGFMQTNAAPPDGEGVGNSALMQVCDNMCAYLGLAAPSLGPVRPSHPCATHRQQ